MKHLRASAAILALLGLTQAVRVDTETAVESQLIESLQSTLQSALQSEARGDADAAVAKTAAIKNIQKALTARILKRLDDGQPLVEVARKMKAIEGMQPQINDMERRLGIMQSVEPVLENAIKTLQKVVDVRGMGKSFLQLGDLEDEAGSAEDTQLIVSDFAEDRQTQINYSQQEGHTVRSHKEPDLIRPQYKQKLAQQENDDFEEVTTPDFDTPDLEMFQKVTAEKNKESMKLTNQQKTVSKPQPKAKEPIAPKKIEAKPVNKYVKVDHNDEEALPEYEPIPVDPEESTAGIYDQFLNDEKPQPKPQKVALSQPMPPAKPKRQKTQAYKTFSQEEITYDDRDEGELDHDISLYAKVAANNAEVDAPRGSPSQEQAEEVETKTESKRTLSAGEPDPDNWF